MGGIICRFYGIITTDYRQKKKLAKFKGWKLDYEMQ